MDVIKRKLRGKQMVIEGLISENALLRQSLHQRNRATLAKESREASSSNVLQSGYSEVPSNSFVTQPQCHSEMQQSHKTQVQHEKQIRQPVMQDTQYATHQRQERLMPSSSQAQKLPTQSSVRNKLQEQLPAADLEEIESFFHKIQHQLQSSQNDGNGTQLSVNSGQTQQSSNQTPSKEQIETNLEVTYVTSVRTVQTQKRTPNLQPMQIDQRNNPCRTVPQQNLQRSSLPSYHSLTHNLQTSQQSGPGQGLQNVNQVHLNSTQKHVLPQHSPQQHFVKGHQPHKHLHKKTSTNLQLPNNSPQLVYAQRHQNTHQFHNSLPQNHHSIQHTPQTSFQNHINPQQIPNNASHNVHPPLQSPQPEIQRFHNPQQIQNNTNYHVQPSQQNLQWVPFVQKPTSKCIHHFPPPQQAFQGSPNLMPPQHSPSIGPLPQQAKSIQEYSTSQQGLQRQHLPPSQFGNHQSVCNVQINPPPLLRPDLPSETFHRPQHSPQNQELRPKPTKVMPPPNYRAPLLPQQNQQLNVTPQHSQAVSSSSQQMSLSRGLEEARYQLRGSQRSYGSSKKRKQQNIEDKRISDLSSIQNPLGQMHVSHTDSPDPPQQNKEPHITQPQSSPSNHTERHKNISSPVMESNQKAVSSNQQNSDSLPSTSTVHYNSCTQNESVPDNEKARKIEEKISAVMCQEKSGLVETSKENTNYVEGPFLEIVKEEPLSDLPDNSMETSPQWSNIGKKISIEDSLGVSEFFHLEEITASVPVAKLSNRPESVSGPKKRSSVGESSLDRNTDIPPQSIITPPQTPPTPIPSTSARGASPGLSINATQVMKALAYQAYHHGMVETDFTYCNAVQDNENNMPVPNNVSDETKAPIDSLPTLDSPVLQRNKSNDSASFSTKSKTIDTSIHNSEGENSISKTSEKGSGELVEKLSLENNKDNLQGISGHVTDLASPNPEDGAGLTKAPDNSPQEELQDAELIASNSVETDKKSKISGCQEFSFPKNRNSQESRGSEEEITILEQACTEEISSEQACKEEISSEQACTKEISSEQACKEEISSEQACTKEISSEQACKEEISSEQACTKEISSEQAFTKEISSEQAFTKEISSEQACTKEISSEQAFTKEISSEQAFTKEISSEQACTKEISSEQAFTKEISSEQACTKEISSEQACTKEISSEQACTKEISSEQACTKEISSEQACTKEISSEQACTKEISSEQACTKEINSEQACTKEISSEQACTKEKSSEQACTKEISSEQACTKEKSSEQACTKEMCLEQASKPSVSSNIECSEVCPSNCSEVDKPSENSFDKEGNDVDRFQPGRYKECVTNSVDSEEKSQQIEYLIETVESDSVEGGNCSSLLENSLSDLDGLVEYVHISDYPDECEKKIFTKWEEIVDGQTDYEVCHNESNVTERRWRIEKDTASDFDKEKNGSVLEIFLSVDEVTGKLTDQNKIPEWCPMCYTDICPSRITVNADTFDMKAICIGCDLTILMIWGSKTQASIDEERPCPKSKKRRLNSVPKLLFVRH